MKKKPLTFFKEFTVTDDIKQLVSKLKSSVNISKILEELHKYPAEEILIYLKETKDPYILAYLSKEIKVDVSFFVEASKILNNPNVIKLLPKELQIKARAILTEEKESQSRVKLFSELPIHAGELFEDRSNQLSQ